MTTEEKKVVANYMGRTILINDNQAHTIDDVCFDLNDAGSVVKEMVKRGDLNDFIQFSWRITAVPYRNTLLDYFAFMFDEENFFKTFVEWRNDANKNT